MAVPGDIPALRAIDRVALAALCDRHRIKSIRIFGSTVSGNATDESDVDLLLEFAPGVNPDLFELGGIQQDLSDLFGREVDLKTGEMFSQANLERILRGSVLGYAA